MKHRFSASYGLNRNWRKILTAEPHWMDELDKLVSPDYELKDRMKLMISGLYEYPTCKMCNNKVKSIDSIYCGKKCSASDPDVKEKKLESTDIEAKNQKIRESLTGRPELVRKSWESRREMHGESGFSEQGRAVISQNGVKSAQKRKDTMIERYGVDNMFKHPVVIETITKRQKEKNTARNHLPDWLFDKNGFTEKWNEKGFSGVIQESGAKETLVYSLSREYGIRTAYESVPEKEISDYITSLGKTVVRRSRRIIAPLEIDIFVPECDLAIEFDGLYWHSAGTVEECAFLKRQHLDKTILCEEKGIHLLHIFENEWYEMKDIWKSVIRQKLGMNERIPARKCVLKEIDTKTANDFCIDNHLQGKCVCSTAQGLFYNGELVMIATWGKPRYSESYGVDLELLRMCSKKGVVVVGGSSKLTKGKRFISYANRRWSFGNVYEKLGMNKVSFTKPGYFYVKHGILYGRQGFMKHKLAERFGDNYDESLSETENCFNNGYRKIWDCGNILYIK